MLKVKRGGDEFILDVGFEDLKLLFSIFGEAGGLRRFVFGSREEVAEKALS